MITATSAAVVIMFGARPNQCTVCTSTLAGTIGADKRPVAGFGVQNLDFPFPPGPIGKVLPENVRLDGPRYDLMFAKVESIDLMMEHLKEAREYLTKQLETQSGKENTDATPSVAAPKVRVAKAVRTLPKRRKK